jgi:type IV secretory pathway VirB10-like protein
MKQFWKNYFVLAFVLILTLAFLIGCAKQEVQTKAEEKPTSTAVVKEEPAKPAPEPPKPEPPKVSGPPKKEAPPAPPRKEAPPPPPQASAPQEVKEPPQRTTEVALSSVNLREGPSMKQKITRVVKKNTKLIVLEEKLGWLHVRLEDGAEGWVAKSMTTEGVQPSPAAPPKGKK